MRRFFILTALLAFSGCAPIYVHADLNPEFAQARPETIAWGAEPPLIAAPPDLTPDRAEIIQGEIRRQLTAKGYRWTDDQDAADLLVVYLAHSREVDLPRPGATHDFDDRYRFDRFGYEVSQRHFIDRYEVRTETINQGHIDVNIWDRATGRIYWHGYVERITDDISDENVRKIAEKAFRRLFESLPDAAARP